MKSRNLRTILITILIASTFVILAGTVKAQKGNSSIQGWDNSKSHENDFAANSFSVHPVIDPPSFSVHPIDDPEDIPEFRAAMKQYIQDLREYLRDVLNQMRDERP